MKLPDYAKKFKHGAEDDLEWLKLPAGQEVTHSNIIDLQKTRSWLSQAGFKYNHRLGRWERLLS
jgi:hypothetical protein